MVKIVRTRKARFKSALMRVGMTQGDWAEQYDLSRGYVNMVLNEKMKSVSLTEKIDAFIADVEAKVLAA